MENPKRYHLRKEIFDAATKATTEDRNKSYGEPDEDFQRIARIATAIGFRFHSGTGLARELVGSDVSLFMMALKLSRLSWNPTHKDSWIDTAGYAACGFETATFQEERAATTLAEEINVITPMPQPGSVTTFGEEQAQKFKLAADVYDAAEKAIKGDPAGLEELGFILIDNSVGPCSGQCKSRHTLTTACQYRVKRRRHA